MEYERVVCVCVCVLPLVTKNCEDERGGADEYSLSLSLSLSIVDDVTVMYNNNSSDFGVSTALFISHLGRTKPETEALSFPKGHRPRRRYCSAEDSEWATNGPTLPPPPRDDAPPPVNTTVAAQQGEEGPARS